jgi:uncharacterized protein (DUF885 family)
MAGRGIRPFNNRGKSEFEYRNAVVTSNVAGGTVRASDQEFAELASGFIDDWAERHPGAATALGYHRFDGRLPDWSAAAMAAERCALDGWAGRLAVLDAAALSAEHQVDKAIITNVIERRRFEIDELREHTWNPLLANPGQAIYQLLARDFAPAEERLASLAGRLAEMPATLAAATEQLGPMPQVHIETAIGQLNGTIALITQQVDAALQIAPQCAGMIEKARPAALDAVTAFRDWLSAQLSEAAAVASPRIGAEMFARKLSLRLNAAANSDAILARARADLDRVTAEMTELAGELGGSIRDVLDRLAADAPDDAAILGFCRDALTAQTAFVREHQLATVYPDPVEVIAMPEVDRGVVVAYCDSPGPLEPAPQPTFLGVSPAPASWTAQRVASFYREYNRHLVHILMAHEAMPGHYLQLAHARRFAGSDTLVRAGFSSSSFAEGWAVYAEGLMTAHGYPGDGDVRHLRMQRLKLQLRMVINAILDAGVHAHGMTQGEAMALMLDRGFQEEGEAAGKWRRILLKPAELSAGYVGYTEVTDLARDMTAAHPGWTARQLHDTLLAHGSPPPRLLRTLVL